MSKSGSRPERLDAVFEWLDRGHFARSERPLDWRVARWLDVMGVAFIFYFSVSTKLLSSLILDPVWEVFQVVDRSLRFRFRKSRRRFRLTPRPAPQCDD